MLDGQGRPAAGVSATPAKSAAQKHTAQTRTPKQPTLARTNASWALHHRATVDGRTLYTDVKRMRRDFAQTFTRYLSPVFAAPVVVSCGKAAGTVSPFT